MLESQRVGQKRQGEPQDHLVFLSDTAARDPEVSGRKAATLARLAAEGYRVPDGFVIPVSVCGAIAGAGREPAVPPEVRASIAAALRRLGGGPVAVRSSGRGEDGSEASFAGQFESVLNVRGEEEVCRAVAACLASARSPRADAYRERAAGDAAMAVLVQRMVEAEAAGVAFSAHPVTGEREETLVHAVSGLGDALVGGAASPDEWVLRGREIERAAAPSEAIDEPCARAVAALADELERYFGAPQDIEWAFAAGELHLLQSRPITALPAAPEIEVPPGTWMKDTVHYPGPLTPFGASVFLPALEEGIRSMCAEFGLLIDRVEQRSFGGEAYGRPVPVGEKEGPPPPWWLMAILVRVLPPLRKRMAAAREVVRSGLLEELPERWERAWREAYREECERMRAVDLASLSERELEAHLDAALAFQRRGQRLHFRLLLPYAAPLRELVAACKELLGWSDLDAMELLAGLSETSSEPARALRDLAKRARASAAAREALRERGAELFERLEEADPDIARELAAYRDRYGWRSVEYDSGAPTLGERPGLLAALLADAVAAEERERSEEALAARRERAEARAREALAGRSDEERGRFERALARARRTYPLREDNVFWTDNMPSGLLRRTALEIGRRLVRAGRLPGAEDAVFLEVDELRRALRGELAEVRELVARRRAEHAWVQTHPGPAFRGGDPAPPPDVRGLPQEGRLLNGALLWLMDHEYGPRSPREGAALSGTAAAPGTYTGPARVVRGEHEFDKLHPGDVLVCPVTSPAWSVLFGQAGALVTDHGSVVSHAAIVAREHAIPAVVGVGSATGTLRDGQMVTVHGSTGEVVVEDDPETGETAA